MKRAWTPREIAILSASFASGVKVTEIAKALGRSYEATKAKARGLDIRHAGYARMPRAKPVEAEKALPRVARQEEVANSLRPKFGEGEREAVEHTHWTPSQRAALATGISRGSSVEEIARAAGKSIPETYAKIRGKHIRRAA